MLTRSCEVNNSKEPSLILEVNVLVTIYTFALKDSMNPPSDSGDYSSNNQNALLDA